MLRKRFLYLTAGALCVFGALFACQHWSPTSLQRLENSARDTLARIGRKTPPNPQLVFLAIDEASINLDAKIDLEQLYGVRQDRSPASRALTLMSANFPWSREVYALVLQRLVDAGAAAVLFDLTFPTSTPNDSIFRAALDRDRTRVVVGCNFSNIDLSTGGVDVSLTRPTETLIRQTEAIDDRVGFANFWPDEDEVVRRAQFRVTFAELAQNGNTSQAPLLSLSGRGLLKNGHAADLPPGFSNRLFRFTGTGGAGFPSHSLFEIFVPDYWERNFQSGEFFRGKTIIIGAQGNWQHDDHRTPFGAMPGAELHLNAMNAALHHAFLRELSLGGERSVVLLAALVAVIVTLLFRSPWLRLVALAALNGGGALLVLYFFNERSLFLPVTAPATQLNVTVLCGLFFDFAWERREKARMRRTLERYVSRDVVRTMLAHPERYAASLGGVLKPATVLFSDIRGYTKFSAQTDPHQLVTQLNEYLTAMVECVFRHGGTLDKFIGDALMAVWGNVESAGPQSDAVAAVRAAREMKDELRRLNGEWRARGWRELRVGIALHHGPVVSGNIGSPQRMEFTVIGEAVNISWKLQEFTKQLGTELVVSGTVAELVADQFELPYLAKFRPPGLSDEIAVFEVASSSARLVAPEPALAPV